MWSTKPCPTVQGRLVPITVEQGPGARGRCLSGVGGLTRPQRFLSIPSLPTPHNCGLRAPLWAEEGRQTMSTTAPAIGTGWECCSRACPRACLKGGAEEKFPPWPTSLDGEKARGAGSTPAQGRSSSLTGGPGTQNNTGDLTGKSGEGVCR